VSNSQPSGRRDYGGRSAAVRRVERRRRLLDAALDLFGTNGYAATSIERLCGQANVSTRNFYEEFAGRESLLIALHDHITERAYHAVLAAVADLVDASTEERVDRAVSGYIGTVAADPRWTRIAFVEVVGVSAAVERHRLAWRGRLAQLVESEAAIAMNRGEATKRDFSLTAMAFIGAVNELVHHWSIHGQQVSLDRIRAELTRLAMAALTAP
jgi:AcrR family transcriptional regulator